MKKTRIRNHKELYIRVQMVWTHEELGINFARRTDKCVFDGQYDSTL